MSEIANLSTHVHVISPIYNSDIGSSPYGLIAGLINTVITLTMYLWPVILSNHTTSYKFLLLGTFRSIIIHRHFVNFSQNFTDNQ